MNTSKINTKLDFSVMSNPFGIKKLTEVEAINLIKDNGFKIKRLKEFGKTYAVKPIGNEDDVYNFLETCLDDRIHLMNKSIVIS